MNDEIREILENCEKAINEASGYNDTTDKIIDYITNLQQEIQKKEAMYDSLAVDYRLAQEENERLKENNQSYQEEMARTWKIADDYKSRVEKAVEQAKEKIKRYESYINDLKKGNYPSPTIRQERQELIFRIREQEDLLNILQNGSEEQMATIDLKLKSYDELSFEIMRLNTDNFLKQQEIDRLNNVINELEKYIRNYINLMINNPDIIEQGQLDILYEVLDKLKELKENRDEE